MNLFLYSITVVKSVGSFSSQCVGSYSYFFEKCLIEFKFQLNKQSISKN